MDNTVVRIDRKGRLVIPKKLRKELGMEDCYVEIRSEGDEVLKPIKSIADRYFGAFKVEKWPEDLDEFLMKEASKWLKDT